ncbi:MAG: TonB-dependent receptor domain-containing protein [Steroidobacterales bacterium]
MRTSAMGLPLGLAVAAGCLFGTAAQAQRANDNAVTAASDAFGTVVGNQSIGLYSESNARGFSPAQAENLRIDGLYYDQQTSGSDPYLFSRSDIRVGIAAQSYPFPSPTGIADLTLRVPGDLALTSVVLTRGPLQLGSAEIDGQYPLLQDSLSLGIVVAAAREFDYGYAAQSNERAASLLLRIRPTDRIELVPFIGYTHNTERRELPLVYADGIHPPPLFDEQHLATQSWTPWRWNELTAGAIGSTALGEGWSLRAGLFRSKYEQYRSFYDMFQGPMPDGTVDHVLDVTPGHVSTSDSGDMRLTRIVTRGNHQREVELAVRGRNVRRSFGGDALAALGTASLYQGVTLPEPALAFAAPSVDIVRQTGLGINDIERWKDHASLSIGLLATHYAREVDSPGMPAARQRTTKVLPTASLALRPLQILTLYGSYTRGLEDSQIAPSYAVNRGEPPAAMPTWQADGGARLVLGPDLKLLLGAFKIHKTYFAVDTANLYTALGDISARGLESSATWTRPGGLTLIAGAVWLRPEVSRRVSEAGASGDVPIGPVPGTINVNVDYAPAAWRGWGTSLKWKWLSSRVATSDDRYRLRPLNTLNMGIRYTGSLLSRQWSVRLDVGNATNTRGLTLGTDYSVVPQLARNYTLTVAADL